MPTKATSIAISIVISCAAIGCGEEEPAETTGTTQPDIAMGAAGPTDPMTEASGMARLDVLSTAFEHGDEIPREFTCDGADASPPLQWSPGPAGTTSYAVIMEDPDAPRGTWVHWIVWNIPEPGLTDVIPARDQLDDGTCQGNNSWPRLGYVGPCPPSGAHRYYFRVYALDRKLNLPKKTDKDGLVAAMQDHVLAQGELMGTYARKR